MASHATMLACLCASLLALAASGMLGLHLLPSWLLVPILRLQNLVDSAEVNDGAQSSGPEEVLVRRLRKVDAAREPAKAHSLHAAIGNMLRVSGTKNKEALYHFEAARDAAARGTDTDTLLAAHLQLADAYIEEGRASDSQREVTHANRVLADHFTEHQSKLNRARGRAKFELTWTESALDYFEEAKRHAVQPEDEVRAACDIAMAQACLGQASKSIEPLKQALEVLNAARKAGPEGGMPPALHTELAAEIHLRLAEAFHSVQNTAFARAHYTKALHLQKKSPVVKAQRISAIEKNIENLDEGEGPELHCPRRPRAPWEKANDPPQDMKQESRFVAKINKLLAAGKYDLAEKDLKEGLRTHGPLPYKSLEAANALNMLGDLYRKQSHFVKAAKHYRQALHAAIVCCGAENPEATKAYEGLRDVKPELPLISKQVQDDQRIAAAAIDRYFDVLEKAGVAVIRPDDSISPLQTSSQDSQIV